MKLLFIVNVDWFFLSHRLPIAVKAKKLGYDIHIATKFTQRIKELEGLGFTLHPIKFNRGSTSIFSIIKLMIDFYLLYSKLNPEVVHLITIKPVIFGGLMARFTSVPCVVMAISGLGFVYSSMGRRAVLRRFIVNYLYKFSFRHKNLKVIFQNKNDIDNLVAHTNLAEEKIKLIKGSGVNLNDYSPSPLAKNSRLIIFAARLLISKGIRDFIQASRIYKEKYAVRAHVRFIVVGIPDKENPGSIPFDELMDCVKAGLIEHWGYCNNMPEILASAYAVVLPSYYGEGLPKILIEAAACGRAIITTNHPGCRDAIEHGETGILIPIGDSASLADAINFLVENPEKCELMGRAGREFAERNFDIKNVVDMHLKIYDELSKNI